jgi:hypothetical protein
MLLAKPKGWEAAMNQEYDVFEKLPDGSALWKDVAVGVRKGKAESGILGYPVTQ